jgi:hypothetical protein
LDPSGIDVAVNDRGQNAPSCVSVGGDFWVSYHTETCDSTYSNVYLTRVSASGTVLDPDGLPICTAEGEQRQTSLAYGDGQLMVLWEDDRNYDENEYDIYGTRITADGTALDPDGFVVAQLGLSEQSPDLCWTGETYLAVWQISAYGAEGDITGARVDTSGTVLDSPALAISVACDPQILGACDWSGQSYLAVWAAGGDLSGTRVDRFGNVLDSAGIDVCSDAGTQSALDLVWGAGDFLAVWEDSRNGDQDIYGARIDSTGTVLDSPAFPVWVDASTDQRYPAVDFDGTRYLVVWQNMLDPTGSYYRIEGLRVSQLGQPLDPEPFAISSGDKGGRPDAAFGGGKYLVVWQDNFFYDIYGALVDTMGADKSEFGIRTSSGVQESPAVASNGSQFLVVWVDYGSHWPNSDIIGSRVTAGGTVLDPSGILIASSSDAEMVPSVTFDGVDYVVSWSRSGSETSQLYVSRVSSLGTVLDPGGIPITDISGYSATRLSGGPLSYGLSDTLGQSLVLYSKYQSAPYNSVLMLGALFWGQASPNYPPQEFSLLLPADGQAVSKPVALDWEDAADSDPSDQAVYTVYVSPSELFPPESTLVIDDLVTSNCQVSPEKDSLIYWWKVKAQDRWGQAVWSNQIFRFDLETYGDVNGDGRVDLGDVVLLLNYLFKGGAAPQPLSAGDANGDCSVDIGDAIYLLNYLFKAGTSPAAGCT